MDKVKKPRNSDRNITFFLPKSLSPSLLWRGACTITAINLQLCIILITVIVAVGLKLYLSNRLYPKDIYCLKSSPKNIRITTVNWAKILGADFSVSPKRTVVQRTHTKKMFLRLLPYGMACDGMSFIIYFLTSRRYLLPPSSGHNPLTLLP
jgi:hypothetical protein